MIMSRYLLGNDGVFLRRTELEDLDYVLSTEQDPENKRFVFQWSREQHEEAIASDDALHLIVEDAERRKLGYVIIRGLQNPHNCIEIFRINLSVRNQGYGKKVLKLVLDDLFNHWRAHRVWLDVREGNERALQVYQSLGFQVEGTLRECVKTEDKYESLIIMGILKTEYCRMRGGFDDGQVGTAQ
jgi:RimJ/RimL family protein N-acetyltransferase